MGVERCTTRTIAYRRVPACRRWRYARKDGLCTTVPPQMPFADAHRGIGVDCNQEKGLIPRYEVRRCHIVAVRWYKGRPDVTPGISYMPVRGGTGGTIQGACQVLLAMFASGGLHCVSTSRIKPLVVNCRINGPDHHGAARNSTPAGQQARGLLRVPSAPGATPGSRLRQAPRSERPDDLHKQMPRAGARLPVPDQEVQGGQLHQRGAGLRAPRGGGG